MHQSKFKAGYSKLKVVLVYLLIASCAGVAFLSLPGIFSNILPVVIPIILFQPPQIQVPTAVLPFNSNLQSAAITPDGTKLYASDSFNNTVSVIDLSINEVIAILDVGNGPSSIAITPDGSKAYVTNSGTDAKPGNTVSVIDIPTNQISTIIVGLVPTNIAITPDGSKAYLTNSGTDAEPGNTVSVIDVEKSVIDPANAVIATVIVGTRPGVIAILPDGSRVYVANLNSNTVSVIQTSNNGVIATVSENVGPTPIGIAIAGDKSKLYVANFGTPDTPGNTVSIIDIGSNEVINTVTVEPNPIAILINPDSSRVYVANTDTITVIDIRIDIVINKIFVRGGGPTSIVITPDGSKVYLASSGRNRVFVIDVSFYRIIATIFNEGSKPSSMAITPDGSNLYVTNFSDDTVSVISTSTNTVIDKGVLEGMNDTGAVPCSPLSIAK